MKHYLLGVSPVVVSLTATIAGQSDKRKVNFK